MKKYLNKFLNKKSDFTEDDKLRALNEEFFYIWEKTHKLLNFILPLNIKYFLKFKKLYVTKLILIIFVYFSLFCGIIGAGILALNYFRILKVTIPNKIEKSEKVIIYKSDSTMNLKNYLIQIAYGESRYIINSHRDGSKYYGIFQIGRNEINTVGYIDISNESFLKHEDIQILTMIKLLKLNKKIMQTYIDKYSGKIIDGILITESGILALCQLGSGTAQNYLNSGNIPVVDEYGNKPRDLLKIGGYKLNLDKMDDKNIISIIKYLN